MVYILSPIATYAYNFRRDADCFVGAATNKTIGMARALNSSDEPASVIALPITTNCSGRLVRERLECVEFGVPIVFLQSLRIKGLNRLIGAWAYLTETFRRFQNGDTLILYNFFLEYLPSVLFVRVRYGRNSVVMDLEDAPEPVIRGIRTIVDRIAFRMMRQLASEHILTVNPNLAKLYGHPPNCVVPGVTAEEPSGANSRSIDGPLSVLFGGTLSLSTGVGIFVEAVHEMLGRQSEFPPILITVTGLGSEEAMMTLESLTSNSKVQVRYRGRLDNDEYRKIALGSHVGLSLKIPSGAQGTTTFPSKMVELAGFGLLVVSTKLRDIETVFDSSQAVYLDRPDGPSLANALIILANQRNALADTATRGRERAFSEFGIRAVGIRMSQFIKAVSSAQN